MKDVFEALVLFTNYAILAVFAQNAVFTRGLGVSRLVQLVGDSQVSSKLFVLMLCITQVLVAPLAQLAGSLLAPLPGRAALRPLVFLGCVAVVCLVLGLAVYPLLHLQDLSLNPLAFKNLVVGYVQGMFSRFTIFAALYFVIALLLGELLGFRKRRQKDKLYVMDADNNPINPAE